MRTLSACARKSSCSMWVTKVRVETGASAWTPGGGFFWTFLFSNFSMKSAGTCGSSRPVVLGACLKLSFARRLSRINFKLRSRALSFERQEAHAIWAADRSSGQAGSETTAASHKASSSRLAGLARGPLDAPSGRVVRQSGEAARRRNAISDVRPRAARATLHTSQYDHHARHATRHADCSRPAPPTAPPYPTAASHHKAFSRRQSLELKQK